MNEELRTLEIVCSEEDFHVELMGGIYCSLSMSRKVNCLFISEHKDTNGLYICNNLKYNEETIGST